MKNIVLALVGSFVFLASMPASSKTKIEIHVKCLADNIYYEAANQGELGMVAVSKVVINRTNDRNFPSTVCEVVKQKYKKTCQFSWVCKKHKARVNETVYAQAWEIARKTIEGEIDGDPTNGSLFFHSTRLKPQWSRRLTQTATIGDHIFYKLRQNKNGNSQP